MPISIEDLVSFSEELAGSDAEVKLRSAVSRFYYAAFHAAIKAADSAGVQQLNLKAGTHEEVSLRYANHVKNGKSFEYILLDMKAKRVQADYFLKSKIDKIIVDQQRKMVLRFFDKLRTVEKA